MRGHSTVRAKRGGARAPATVERSSTSGRVPRSARWKASDAPWTPAPAMIASAVPGLAARYWQRAHAGQCRLAPVRRP